MLLSTLIAYLKSVTFIGLFVSILTYMLCLTKNYRQKIDAINPIISSFVCSFTSIMETEDRRKEINLFILPRAIETIYQLLRRRGYIIDLSDCGSIMFGLIVGFTNYFYQNEHQYL